jgi:prepilin-type N-terminal cleavage/methylation domain-containing protein/prepilin-type processing-associated H-X9-DG protein
LNPMSEDADTMNSHRSSIMYHRCGDSSRGAFTLIELLVVIAIIALLMSILMPALSRAREQGKRAACMNNTKSLALGWNLYADDYDAKIMNANTATGAANRDGVCWVYYVSSATATEQEKIDGLRRGLIYPYCPSDKLFKCPTGVRGEVVTYAIPDSMNGYWAITESIKPYIKTLKTQIRNLSEQIVFLDEGRLSPSSWTIWFDQERWWDQITARHGDGTNFSFGDLHTEYWKWKDPRTLEVAKMDYNTWQGSGRQGAQSTQPGNEDLHRVQRGCFGKLGYTPSQN